MQKIIPTIKLYLIAFFLATFVLAPEIISLYYPNTSEHVMKEFFKNATLFPNNKFTGDMESLWGTFLSSSFIGRIIGSILSTFINVSIGRKCCAILAAMIEAVGLMTQFSAPYLNSILFLMTGRVVSSVGFGIANNAVTVYLTEISPLEDRGSILVWVFSVVLEIMFALSGLLGHSKLMGTEDLWHWTYAGLSILCLIGATGLIFLNDTPDYCIYTSNDEAAKEAGTMKLVDYNIENKRHKQFEHVSLKDGTSLVAVGAVTTMCSLSSGRRQISLYSTMILQKFGWENLESFNRLQLV